MSTNSSDDRSEDVPGGSPPVVLVVDDDEDLAETCEFWLADGQYESRVANSGEEALEVVDEDVDAVLLDRRMPTLSGDDVLSELRERGFDVPVAMMTAVAPDTDIVEMPFDEYLVKPVSREDVLDAIDELLARADFEDEVREYFAKTATEAALSAREEKELGDTGELASLREELEETYETEGVAIDERERELERLTEINAVLRDVSGALVDADSRESIERAVCASIVEQTSYDVAWISEYNARTDRVEARAGAGTDLDRIQSASIDEISSVVADAVSEQSVSVVEDASPTHRDVILGESTVSMDDDRSEASDDDEDRSEASDDDEARSEAIDDDEDRSEASDGTGDRSVGSSVSVIVAPLSYREKTYGALLVYARRPREFSAREQAVFEELGGRIGNGIKSVEQRQLLLADTVVELEFQHSDRSDPFVDVSASTGTTVSLKGVASSTDASLTCYVEVSDGRGDAFLEAASAHEAVSAVRVVADGDPALLEVTVTSSAVVTVSSAGAAVESFRVEAGDGRLVVEVAPESDLKALARAVESTYEGASLLSKRRVERSVQSSESFRQALEERLTDRQQGALETAFAAGYYKWPRESTAEEVAAAMDISSPTLHEHLRAGERKLLRTFLDEVDDE